jgi:succinyl-CoA synthetase beta subunit
MAHHAALRIDEREMIPPFIREPDSPPPQKKGLAPTAEALGLQGPRSVRLDGGDVQKSKPIIRSSGLHASAADDLHEKA